MIQKGYISIQKGLQPDALAAHRARRRRRLRFGAGWLDGGAAATVSGAAGAGGGVEVGPAAGVASCEAVETWRWK